MIFGSVIPRIRHFQLPSIAVRVPDDDGLEIHSIIESGFDMRAEAHDSEDRAITLFETAIQQGRELTEAEWGSEY